MNLKIIFFTLLLITSCATNTKGPRGERGKASGQVSVSTNIVMLDHKYFKIAYDQDKRLARYVVYQLTAENLSHKNADRKNKFKADPILKAKNIPYVLPSEYTRSNYDRGHLAPAADFSWNQEANDLTFVMSNMAPQSANLNRDAWKRLEGQVRKWACGEKVISVITGPVLRAGLPRLKSGLEIPQEFFKIVIDETPPVKMISFIYHQNDRGDVLAKRLIPVNQIEETIGIALQREIPQMKNLSLRMPAAMNEWKEGDCAQTEGAKDSPQD